MRKEIVISSLIVVLVLATTLAIAQTTPQTPTSSPVQTAPRSVSPAEALGDRIRTKTQVTVRGCVQREAEYLGIAGRREGQAGSAVGSDDELMVVDATPATAAPAKRRSTTGTSGATAAYGLTGKREDDLKAYVGKRVEIVGLLEDDKIDVTSFRSVAGTCR
jgi:hypothetical protein